jgi:hypothetical protein
LACSGSNEVLVAGSCVAANCTGSSSVVLELGVCLSDLVQVPPTSSTTTSGSGSGSMPVPTSSSGVTGSKGSTAVKRHKLLWWQILLITLGCLFFVILILVLWRRWVRKQREKDTVMFASAKHLDGGDGWRWRLKQFRRLLFGGKKGGYDADVPPPMSDFGDTVSHTRLDTATLDGLRSPTISQYMDDPVSPQLPPRSKYRPPAKRLDLKNRPPSLKRRSSNPSPSRKYRLDDDRSPGWLSDGYPLPKEWPLDDPPPQKGWSLDNSPSPRGWLLEDPSLPKRYRSDTHSPTLRYHSKHLSSTPKQRPSQRICLDDPLENSNSDRQQSRAPSGASRVSEVRLNYLSPPPSYPAQ